MGYTINWRRPVELPQAGFASAVAEIREVLPLLGVALAGFDGTGEPLLGPDHIVFNGAAPLACEPFEIARVEFDRRGTGVVRSFCKTQHLPYGRCVKAALIILCHHLGEQILVSSDGDDGDWVEPRQLVQKLKGYGDDFRIVKDGS